MLESDDRYFALWNDYYRLGDYQNASQAFTNIENYQGLYNAGNAFFKFWDEVWSIDGKIRLWTQSVDFYTKSLEVYPSVEAEQNYEFVKSKLDELLEQQEEEKQEETNDQSTDSEEQNSESSEENSSENQKETQENTEDQSPADWESSWDSESSDNITPQPRAEEYKLWEDSSVPELSQSEAEYLERYIDNLKELEKQNQRFFNKTPEESFSRDAFDSFMNPFGSGDSRWEKDW